MSQGDRVFGGNLYRLCRRESSVDRMRLGYPVLVNIDDYQRLAGETAIYPGRGGTLGAMPWRWRAGDSGKVSTS